MKKRTKNLSFGLFIILIGCDIFFSEPFISRGTIIPSEVGILFWIWGLIVLAYGIISKKAPEKR
jgi:hypothetical protein